MWNYFWGDNGDKGIVRFRRIVTVVQEKLRILRACRFKVSERLATLTTESKIIKDSLPTIKENLNDVEGKRKLAKATGVAVSTAGSTISAGLWIMTALTGGAAAPLALAATGAAGGLGFATKLGTSYFSNRSKEGHLIAMRKWEAAETSLKQEFKNITEIIQTLYLGDKKEGESKSVNAERVQTNQESTEEDPAIVAVLDKVDQAGAAPGGIEVVLEQTSNLGVESANGLSETFDAAKSSVGEYVSLTALEGAFSGLGVVMSAYEVFSLIKEWDKKDPTLEEVDRLANDIDNRINVYKKTRLCLDTIDYFVKSRKRK